jgi:hypothetical protein
MSPIDWPQVAHEFEPDGSLRDIYVSDTSSADWQAVLDHLREKYGPVRLTVDGVDTPVPAHVRELFAIRERANPELGFLVAGMRLACHLFTQDEIEFDLRPEEVTGPDQLNALVVFLRELGRITGKSVALTPENLLASPILRFQPGDDVAYLPDRDARAG